MDCLRVSTSCFGFFHVGLELLSERHARPTSPKGQRDSVPGSWTFHVGQSRLAGQTLVCQTQKKGKRLKV